MKAKLVRIGNSRGVRIPQAVIRACALGAELELTVADGAVVLRAARGSRQGWDEAFAGMARAGDDAPLLDEATPSDFDRTEWRW